VRLFSLCDLWPNNDKIPKGTLLVVLRSYFDGGNQADSRVYNVVSLAVVSGTKNEWKPFEKDWKKVLRRHRADFLHTTDAVTRNGIYEGWDDDQVDEFLSDCSRVARQHCARVTIGDVPGKFGLYPFVVTIDLKDFVCQSQKDPEALQNADEGCMRQAVEEVLIWAREKANCDKCNFFFDQGEPYYGHLVQWLQNKKAREYAPAIEMIASHSQANMRWVPALQLADLYAWTQNNKHSSWNPKWKQKLLRSHFQWQWIDKNNIDRVRKDHAVAWKSFNLPRRAKTK
jgi:hypothetical protein